MQERDSGQPQRNRQPWLHELAICVRGNVTGLSHAAGDLTGTGAQGLYVDDVRVVSSFVVSLGDGPLDPVGSATLGEVSEFLSAARALGDRGPDPTVEVRRTRRLVDHGMVETISVVNRTLAPVSTTLRLAASADGADIAAVKAGADSQPVLPAAGGVGPGREGGAGSVSWLLPRHEVTMRVVPVPATSTVAANHRWVAELPLDVPAGGSVDTIVEVRARRTTASLFDADAGADAVGWADAVRVSAADRRLDDALHAGLVDLRGLLLRDPESHGDVFAGAGSPWYLTLFGRDSLWTARLALPLGTEIAAGTLRALARRQGAEFNAERAEAPGKIAHELRRVDYVDPVSGLALPPIYYGTVDATALWICLLHDAWRWGLAESAVHDLLGPLRSAAGWLLDIAPGPDGLLRYVDESGSGLVNQGWKDSGDSMRWRDGRIADGPIALVEAQAYAVEAARGAAAVLRALGDASDGELAVRLDEYAARLSSIVRERFWVADGDDRYLAMCLDGQDAAVDGIGSNMGHCLGTGVLTSQEAGEVARQLLDPRLFGRHGIATLARDNGGFNPLGYHTGSVWTHDTAIAALGLTKEGFTTEAAEVALRLLDLAEAFDYRFPELCADDGVLGRPLPYPASCRPQAWATASPIALLTVALGIQADVPGGTLTIRPPAVMPFGPLRVEGLRVGEATISVAVDAHGAVRVDGLPPSIRLITS